MLATALDMKASSSLAPAFQAPTRDPRLADFLENYPPSLFSDRLYRSIELMERYSIDLAIDLLDRLNVLEHLEDWRSPSDLCQILSFEPRFTSALRWLLERLLETGCMEAQTEENTRSFHLKHPFWQPELTGLRTIGLDIDHSNAATLDLLDHAASLYPSVARAEGSGDQMLFGPQGIPLWLNYFSNDNLTYAVNNLLTAIVAADRLFKHSRLRILEVGAGAGSASDALLGCLAERQLLSRIERYFITEPNAFLRRRAQRELSNRYPDLPLEWAALDLNSGWEGQGIAADEFDLVYAVNVLHISKNLLFSLHEGRSALARDGWFVIGECLRPYPNQPIYAELMFQILESFTDVQLDPDTRPTGGFLTADQWRGAFQQAGFERIEVAPDIERIRELYSHFFTGAICGSNTATGHELG